MRSLKILFCLLLTVHAVFGADYDLAKKLAGLTESQRITLYQYGTLSSFATPVQADSFWQAHQVPGITIAEAKVLANELLINSRLAYDVKKPSRIQTLRGIFTATRLLLGLAGLLAAYALIHLLSRYWAAIKIRLIRYLAPLFRLLFSPLLLTCELLVLGGVAIYLGPRIEEMFIRTLVIHLGLLVIWGQLIALFTKQYFVKDYLELFWDSFIGRHPVMYSFFKVFVPSIIVTSLFVWIISVCDDTCYRYEIVFPAMAALYSFPLVRRLLQPVSRLLYPFSNVTEFQDRNIAGYTVVTLLAWIALLYMPVLFQPALLILTGVLSLLLITVGLFRMYKGGNLNYIYIQIIPFLYLLVVVFIGSQRAITPLTWTGLGALIIYILIKYWEWPAMCGWSWKNKKAWGVLGMALIIWGIASLIRLLPEWFANIF